MFSCKIIFQSSLNYCNEKWKVIIKKNAGTDLCSSPLEMCVRSLKLIFKPFSYWSSSRVHHPETFPQRNSTNHENSNNKFSLNKFSGQITICQISFEIFDVKQTDARAKSKYLCSIRVFPFFHFSLFPFFWNKLEIFKKRHEKDQKQSPQPTILLKKRLCHRCFPVNFAEFPKTPFLTEHLQWLLLKDGNCKADNIAQNVFT